MSEVAMTQDLSAMLQKLNQQGYDYEDHTKFQEAANFMDRLSLLTLMMNAPII